jgi:hypothetical protein
MSAARRDASRFAGVSSNERTAVVEWAARLGAITAESLAVRDRSSAASARARLAGAERAGLLRRSSPLRDSPALYIATRGGLRVVGLSSLDTCRVSASNAAHLAAVAFAASVLERCYPDHELRGERELRHEEREMRAPIASARLCAAGARGSLWHRPDLVLSPALREGLPTAVEVELTVKAPRRLREICRAWARTRCVAGVVYLAAPPVERALRRAIARADAAERVIVLPLSALDESLAGDVLCGLGTREPSQVVPTVSVGGSTS